MRGWWCPEFEYWCPSVGKPCWGTCKKTNHRRSKPERGIKRTWENMKKNSLIKQIRDVVELRWGLRKGVRRAEPYCLESLCPWRPWTCVPTEPPLQDHIPQSSRSHVASVPAPTAPWSWFALRAVWLDLVDRYKIWKAALPRAFNMLSDTQRVHHSPTKNSWVTEMM